MKLGLSTGCAILFLASCTHFSADSTIDWDSEPAGTLSVRGQSFDITKRTGTDAGTDDVFVVEYTARVNGHVVRCVGDINLCPAAIEEELDTPTERRGGMY